MNSDFVRSAVLACGVLFFTVPLIGQVPGNTRCQSDIVSATVVATSCIRAEGETQVLDLLILWRGEAGWFQAAAGSSRRGSGGSSIQSGATKGQVARYTTYGDVTIAFDADFDARTVTIDESAIRLDTINMIFVDGVDRPDRAIIRTIHVDPALPLAADTNLALAQRSRDLRDYLQCEVAMPRPTGRSALPAERVVTVCERLQRQR